MRIPANHPEAGAIRDVYMRIVGSGKPFTSDEIWDQPELAGVDRGAHRAWLGNWVQELRKEGEIRKTGRYRETDHSGPHSRGAIVWQGVKARSVA